MVPTMKYDDKAAGIGALRPAPHIAALAAYVGPQGSPLIDLTLGATERSVLSIDLRDFSLKIDSDSICHYPDARSLEAVLAARFSVLPSQVLVTAGADEALDRVCRAMLCPTRDLVVATPTFEMIPHYAKLAGAEVRTVAWPLHGPYPLQELLATVTANTRVIAVVTPNNPSGAVVHVEEIRRLSHAAPQAVILVDLAYVEYAEHDCTEAILKLPNVVIVKTLSKAWGMPGIRVGYAIGRPEVIGWLRTAGSPYSVSRPALALAHARLQNGEADMRVYVDRVVYERRHLESLLKGLGADVQASQANFVLANFRSATWVTQALAGLGIGVRAFPNAPELQNARRVSCPGDEEAFARLRGAFVAALAPQALLFDMDGVLADVSASYRQAIYATAAHFGVTLLPNDVVVAKAAGNANNDWLLTQRLLQERGVSCSLEEVTACFERLYQGDDVQPGLRQHERLLVDKKFLATLAQRLPLAIVTGRPRADASRFLQENGIVEFFKQVICMEDAPLKPDPAPVRLALERLGVQAAWMVGDTPDDIYAARRAHVVPLAIVAPGDNAERMASVFARAGAARTLAHLHELQELLI